MLVGGLGFRRAVGAWGGRLGGLGMEGCDGDGIGGHAGAFGGLWHLIG